MRWMLPLAAAWLVAACGGLPAASAPPAQALRIDAGAAQPLRLEVAALQSRPAVAQADHFDTGHGPQSHAYTGAALWPLLQEAGLAGASPGGAGAGMAGPLDRYVIATGADGYRTLFSIGELNPEFGNKQVIVAYAETLDGVSRPLSANGQSLRLTAPGDGKGGRYVSDLRRIEVRSAASKPAPTGGAAAPAFTVSGAVERPQRFDIAALQALPQAQLKLNGRVYAGVELRSLLERAGVQSRGTAMNAGLLNYVVATGSDGYRALLSAGEIDPGFGNRAVLVATSQDGKDLGSNGMARLIVPGDGRMGRSVSRLVAIEVLQAP